jgi:hypothetical protein
MSTTNPLGSPFEKYAGWIALGCGIIAAILTIYFFCLVEAVGYVDVPFWDAWGYLKPGQILEMWRHNNEHWIPFPRMVFWLDDVVFKGRNQFNIAVIALIQVAHAAVFMLLARTLGYRSRKTFIFAACAVLVVIMAPSQRENFNWGFEVQFVLVYAAFTAGAYALVRYDATNRPAWLAAALFAGLVSAGSMANGMATLPLLGVMALVMRRPRAALAFSAVEVIAAMGFFKGYLSQSHGPVHHHLNASSVAYGLAYLGNPLALTFNSLIIRARVLPTDMSVEAIWLGAAVAVAAGLSLLSLINWANLRRNSGPTTSKIPILRLLPDTTNDAGRASLALGAIILFILATAAMTTIGRTEAGVSQALSSRYGSSVVTLLAATLLLLGSLWREKMSDARIRSFGIVLFGVALVTFAWSGRVAIAASAAQRLNEERAMLALAANVQDSAALSLVTYSPQTALADFDRLRDEHKSLFSEDWVQAIGKPLSHLVSEGVGGQCEGRLAPLSMKVGPNDVYPYFGPHGDVWAPHDQHPTPTLVMVDSAGNVVGLGRVEATESDIRGGGIRTNHKLIPWQGELEPNFAGVVTAYLLIDGGHKACAIGEKTAVSDASGPGDISQAQIPLAPLGAQKMGSFTLGGDYPDSGSPGRPGPVYGSWSGADSNTGSLRLRYGPAPANATALLVPLLQGAGLSNDLGLRVQLQPSGRVLALIEPSGFSKWGWWRIPLPANIQDQTIEVQAVDDGTVWAEWLAVGPAYVQVSGK